MSSHRIPSAWIDPRPWLLQFFMPKVQGMKWMENECWAMFGYVDPWDVDVQHAIRSSKQQIRTDLFDQECTYLSDCAMYVDFVAHRVYVELMCESHPLHIRKLLGRYLDMFWPLIDDLRSSVTSYPFHRCTREMFIQFARAYNEAWYDSKRPSPSNVPCDVLLHSHAQYILNTSILKVVSSYDAPTPAQEEHAPLITLFRKAWPQKHQIDQFVKKFIRIVSKTENRRVKPSHGKGEIVKFPTGDDVMRHLLQWWCVFHNGGYRHTKVVVSHPEMRKSVYDLWSEIPTLTSQQLTQWCLRMIQQPVVTLCVIKEFMIHTIMMNPAIQDWLHARSKWQAFESIAITYFDRYRKTLPFTPVPEAISRDAAWQLNCNRKTRKQSEKRRREKKRSDRIIKAALSAAHREGRNVADDEKGKGHASVSDDDNDGQKRTSADDNDIDKKQSIWSNLKAARIDPNDERFRVGLYNEEDDYDEKIEVFDEAFIADMNRVTGNPALTQLHILVRSIHDVGASTRVPISFWAFVHNQMPTTTAPGLDLTRRTLIFHPTRYIPSRELEPKIGKMTFHVDTMLLKMTSEIDQQWIAARSGGIIRALGEDEVLAGVEESLRPQFLSMRRVFQMIMMMFHCHPTAIDNILWLISLYYEHSRCGKPTIHQTFEALIYEYPYEYNVVFCLMTAWKEWSTAWRVPLSATLTELQLQQTKLLFPPGVPIDFRADWLLYCRSCKKISSLVDQSVSSGSSYPRHYVARSVSGFNGVFVDIHANPKHEWNRPLYCPRKTGKAAVQCAKAPLKHMKMLGYLCFLHDKAYVICTQPGCGNKKQYDPDVDSFNRFGWMCSVCVETARMKTRLREEVDAAVEKEERDCHAFIQQELRDLNGRYQTHCLRTATMYENGLFGEEELEYREWALSTVASGIRKSLLHRLDTFESQLRQRKVVLPNGTETYELIPPHSKTKGSSEMQYDIHYNPVEGKPEPFARTIGNWRKELESSVTGFWNRETDESAPMNSLHHVPRHLLRQAAKISSAKLDRLSEHNRMMQSAHQHLR